MEINAYRSLCIDAYQKYAEDKLQREVTFKLCDIGAEGIKTSMQGPVIYILRLAPSRAKDPSIAAIPNSRDEKGILYIGGHESNKNTERYKTMIKACLNVERAYPDKGYVENKKHAHPVAAKLTTSLLIQGFSIKDCLLDIIKDGQGYDELEFIIGYEETFHHLPPWNKQRAGVSIYDRK